MRKQYKDTLLQRLSIKTPLLGFLIGVITFALPVWASESAISSASDSVSAQFLVAQYVPTPELYKPVGDGWCVSFVQAHGFEKYTGDAKDWVKYVNSKTPEIGAVVVLNESPLGHLAIVTSFTETTIDIVEQNYKHAYVINYRTLPINYSKILGYVKKTSDIQVEVPQMRCRITEVFVENTCNVF